MEPLVTTVTTVLDGIPKVVTHDIPIELDGVLTESIVIQADVDDAGEIEGPFGQFVSLGSRLVNLRVNGREVESYHVRQPETGGTIYVTTTPKESA